MWQISSLLVFFPHFILVTFSLTPEHKTHLRPPLCCHTHTSSQWGFEGTVLCYSVLCRGRVRGRVQRWSVEASSLTIARRWGTSLPRCAKGPRKSQNQNVSWNPIIDKLSWIIVEAILSNFESKFYLFRCGFVCVCVCVSSHSAKSGLLGLLVIVN